MTEGPPNDPGTAPDSVSAADWATIWKSEWAALAVDREMQEHSQRMLVPPGVPAHSAPRTWAPPDAASRSAGPPPPTWASAAADAPDARDAAIANLLDRVAELERRAAADAAGPAGR